MANGIITGGFNGADSKCAVAGYKAVYMANYEDYDFTLNDDDITGTLMTGLPVTFSVFKYELKNTGNTFTVVNPEGGRNTGTTAFQGTLNLVLTKIDPVKSHQIQQMVCGRPIVFLETNGGEILAVGVEHGVEFTASMVLEGEMTGNNQYQLTGSSEEEKLPYFLDSATITALKGAVTA